MRGYKVLTHDHRPPIQGGEPVWDGTLGAVLPARAFDTGPAECAAGWNFTRRPEIALRIAGLWPNGRPSVLLRIETVGEYVERGDKCRAESIRIDGVCSERVVRAAVREMSAVFGEHAEQMTRDQMAWRYALARPNHDAAKVELHLRTALEARGLDWKPMQFRDTRAAWAAWAARAARDAWDAWDAWDARDAWDAWDAWDARDALVLEYASLCGWIETPAYLLTSGLREAYASGLDLAAPIGPRTLGWSMVGGRGAAKR